jgi:hypothetical protein
LLGNHKKSKLRMWCTFFVKIVKSHDFVMPSGSVWMQPILCFGNLSAYFEFVRKYACCINPLPDLAYANVFAQKSQPFEYPGYVPGRIVVPPRTDMYSGLII